MPVGSRGLELADGVTHAESPRCHTGLPAHEKLELSKPRMRSLVLRQRLEHISRAVYLHEPEAGATALPVHSTASVIFLLN